MGQPADPRDSLLVMTSLAEKEGLRGKVQTIYLDPPYGIKFGSNWQVSTRKRDVKDGNARPFASSGLQTLSSASGLSPELRDLHDQILELRHSVYAHTDETPWREALDAAHSDNFFVSSLYPTPKLLDEISALARAPLPS